MAKAVFGLLVFLLLIGMLRVPATALAGVVCMFAIEQWVQAGDVFFVQNSSVVNLAIGTLLVIAVVIAFFRGDGLLYRYPSVGWITIALFFYSFLSLGWVTRFDIALAVWSERAPYVITLLLLAPLVVSRIQDFRRVFLGTYMLGVWITVLLLFTVKWEFRSIVLAGPNQLMYGNPLAPAKVSGTVVLILLLYRFQRGGVVWTVFRWLLAAGCLLLIIRSGSRGQLIGVLLALLVGWPLSRKIKGFSSVFSSITALTGVGIAAIWLLKAFLSGELGGGEENPYLAEAMKDRWREDAMQESMGGRLTQTALLLSYWIQSPISIVFGLGNSASYDPNIIGFYPHFVPGEIVAEEGVVGFVLYCCVLVLSIKSVRSAYRAVKHDEQQRGMLAILSSVLMYFFLLSLKQGSMLGNVEFFFWAILLGRFERAVVTVPKQVDVQRLQSTIKHPLDNHARRGIL